MSVQECLEQIISNASQCLISVVLDSDWEVARFSKITICEIKL